jgi:hypothetical protein
MALGNQAHLWVVLTDPQDSPSVAIVNLTTQTNIPDEPLVLNTGEHAFIRHKTVVNYAEAKIVSAEELERLIEANLITPHHREPYCTPALLEKIRKGVLTSDFARPIFQQYCRERFPAEGARPSPSDL